MTQNGELHWRGLELLLRGIRYKSVANPERFWEGPKKETKLN